MGTDKEQIVTLDASHSVALFTPGEDALEQAAASGVKSIVNFRAEGETGGLAPDEERRAAERIGLNYLHHPVTADNLSAEAADAFRRKLDDLPQPVLLHCASGKRAGAMTLMALAADKGWDGDTALKHSQERGLDLSQEKIGQFVKAYADRKAGV